MLVDYHNHTQYCHHAVGLPLEYVTQARRLGLSEFGFSEHSPWMVGIPEHPLSPSLVDWDTYITEVSELQARIHSNGSSFRLRLGVEIDYTPEYVEPAREFLENYPFDYVIGSVHSVVLEAEELGPGPMTPSRDLRRYYELYFSQLRMLIESGMVDIIGHLDLPKRDGQIPPAGYLDLVEDLLGSIVESGVVIEINTSGRDKPIGEFFPAPEIVRMLVKAGVPMTLGSDAHSPRDIGRYFPEAVALLRECGAREIITFQNRIRIGHRI